MFEAQAKSERKNDLGPPDTRNIKVQPAIPGQRFAATSLANFAFDIQTGMLCRCSKSGESCQLNFLVT